MRTAGKIVKVIIGGIMWTVAALIILFFLSLGFLSVFNGV